MADNKEKNGERQFTIRMIGIQQGASQEKLIAGLRRLYKNRTPEEIQETLNRLPLVLSRKARKSQALKIKEFLESVGAFVELTDTSPVRRREEVGKETAEVRDAPPPPEEVRPPKGEERRTKPRIHAGIQLHPMGIGELLDRSFRLIREYFWLFFFIILIPQGISFLVAKGLQVSLGGMAIEQAPVPFGAGLGISAILGGFIFIILQFWAQGALIHAVSETYLGHNTSIGGSYGAMRRILGRLLGTMILMVILLLLVPLFASMLVGIFIALLSPVGMNKVVAGIFIFIVAVVAIWAFFRMFMNWLMVDKVVVLERIGWIKSLKRSTELMKGRTEPGFWKSNKMKAGLILLLGVLIGIGIELIFQIPGVLFTFVLGGNLVIQTVMEILSIVGKTLATAFTATAMILFYYDIRLRKEGFDLKMMAENL